MRLKIQILTTLISSILLVNCSKVEKEIDNPNPETISFAPTVVKGDWNTKGAVTPATVVGTVGIMAVICTGNGWDDPSLERQTLVYNGELTNPGGENRVISPIIYWPTIRFRTHFFAYSPRAPIVNDDNNENGIIISKDNLLASPKSRPSISYEMPENGINQPDLMIATKYNQQKDVTGLQVELNFKRVLAAIGFEVKGSQSTKVKSIGIRNIRDEGTISMTPAGGTELYAWDVSIERSTIIYNAGLNFKNSDNFVTPTQEGKNVTADNGYLMVIPQTTTNAEIVVVIDNGSSPDTEKTFPIPTGTEWKANGHYIYSLKLGPFPGRGEYWVEDGPGGEIIEMKGIKLEGVDQYKKPYARWVAPVNAGWSKANTDGLMYRYGNTTGVILPTYDNDTFPEYVPFTGTAWGQDGDICPPGWVVPDLDFNYFFLKNYNDTGLYWFDENGDCWVGKNANNTPRPTPTDPLNTVCFPRVGVGFHPAGWDTNMPGKAEGSTAVWTSDNYDHQYRARWGLYFTGSTAEIDPDYEYQFVIRRMTRNSLMDYYSVRCVATIDEGY